MKLNVSQTIYALGVEPEMPLFAPALASAIFNSTGQRICTLALRKHISFV